MHYFNQGESHIYTIQVKEKNIWFNKTQRKRLKLQREDSKKLGKFSEMEIALRESLENKKTMEIKTTQYP
jgi:hypothetical protein